MTVVVSIFNQSGGVGKTTLTQNLGYHLRQRKHRVLLLDLDPQASLTIFMGLNPEELERTIYQSLVRDTDLSIHKDIYGLDLIPANLRLCTAESELSGEIMKELKLKTLLSSVKSEYDFILMDCPPSLGLLPILSLVAATHLLVPIHCHFKSFIGTDRLFNTVAKVKSLANPELVLAGFVPTMVDKRASQDLRVLEAIKEQLSSIAPIFPAIPRSVVFADASEQRMPLAVYKKHEAVTILEHIAEKLEGDTYAH